MATPKGNSDGGFPLKLLIDGKTNKVIFAEAGKDLVDFFFSLMLLPLGTVVSLLGKKSVPGSMGKLYQSIQNLDQSYLSVGSSATSSEDVKRELMNPSLPCSRLGQGAMLLPWKSSAPKLYRCTYSYCSSPSHVSEVYGAKCPKCSSGQMTQPITLLQSSEVVEGGSNDNAGREKGFVKELVTYTITDDLCIAPLSTISSLSLMKHLKVMDLGALQERLVTVGPQQGLKILETSLRSQTVLSDVFL